ncbi:hypothetical protein cyc_06996 [Cyclospora cayetanensis]|uniref:Uncharacterized protein n=1 Tax=Cyclospora cayetanensis TaxID=88456 RepID=A0A1D3D3S4_9EIME|nr:hypothetical protein cyc_06996 [Cyclospora cayetanensis]
MAFVRQQLLLSEDSDAREAPSASRAAGGSGLQQRQQARVSQSPNFVLLTERQREMLQNSCPKQRSTSLSKQQEKQPPAGSAVRGCGEPIPLSLALQQREQQRRGSGEAAVLPSPPKETGPAKAMAAAAAAATAFVSLLPDPPAFLEADASACLSPAELATQRLQEGSSMPPSPAASVSSPRGLCLPEAAIRVPSSRVSVCRIPERPLQVRAAATPLTSARTPASEKGAQHQRWLQEVEPCADRGKRGIELDEETKLSAFYCRPEARASATNRDSCRSNSPEASVPFLMKTASPPPTQSPLQQQLERRPQAASERPLRQPTPRREHQEEDGIFFSCSDNKARTAHFDGTGFGRASCYRGDGETACEQWPPSDGVECFSRRSVVRRLAPSDGEENQEPSPHRAFSQCPQGSVSACTSPREASSSRSSKRGALTARETPMAAAAAAAAAAKLRGSAEEDPKARRVVVRLSLSGLANQPQLRGAVASGALSAQRKLQGETAHQEPNWVQQRADTTTHCPKDAVVSQPRQVGGVKASRQQQETSALIPNKSIFSSAMPRSSDGASRGSWMDGGHRSKDAETATSAPTRTSVSPASQRAGKPTQKRPLKVLARLQSAAEGEPSSTPRSGNHLFRSAKGFFSAETPSCPQKQESSGDEQEKARGLVLLREGFESFLDT